MNSLQQPSQHVNSQPLRRTPQHTQTSILATSALDYAARGIKVFPLLPGTKIPATPNGLYDATTDPAIIRAWWQSNPNYNIGITGLLFLDVDLYKAPGGNGKIADLTDTVKVNTARKGLHKWYRMPQGKQYGNSAKGLPSWVDVRGVGGYVVAPPSVFVENGKRLPYTFAPGFGIDDVEIAELPASIANILEAAQTTHSTPTVFFSGNSTLIPDLTALSVPEFTLAMIQRGAPKGERSEADYAVIKSLVRSGLDADQIRAIFDRYPIGKKYQEKGQANGAKYLALTIGKVQAHLANDPASTTAADMRALRDARAFMTTATFAKWLTVKKGRRCIDAYVQFCEKVIKLAETRGSLSVEISNTNLGLLLKLKPDKVYQHLKRAVEDGIFKKEIGVSNNRPITVIDVSPVKVLIEVVSNVVGGLPTPRLNGKECEDYFDKDHFVSDLIVNSATKEQFLDYPKHLAMRRRLEQTDLIDSLGAPGLRLWAEFQARGSGNVKQLAARLGWLESKVRKVLARFDAAGILWSYKNEGDRATTYELHPDHEARLEESLPKMATYGIGKIRAAHNHGKIADYALRQVEMINHFERRTWARGCRISEDDSRRRDKMRARWHKHNELANANYSAALDMGINPGKLPRTSVLAQ